MKRLIQLLNTYPGVELNERDFVFSKPVFDKYNVETIVNVKSKLKSIGYIDRDFRYKQFDLDVLSSENRYEVKVTRETTIHELLPKLAKITKYSYQVSTDGNPQDVSYKLTEDDLEDLEIPNTGTDEFSLVIPSKDTSFMFRGKLLLYITRVPYSDIPTSIDIAHVVMSK
jgi:hypothetical protein